MQVAAIGDGDDGGGGETRVAVAVRRQQASSMMVVVVVEKVLISLAMPKQSVGKSRCSIWVSRSSEGKGGHYIALISI